MNHYIYKVYGALSNGGYDLILKTTDIQKARSVLDDMIYFKTLLIRYDVLNNMDEVITLAFHSNTRKRQRKK